MVQYIMLLGDFWEPVVALWSTRSFELLCTVQISVPLHDASFCPFTANELTLIGSSAVVFTRIQTQDNSTELQVHTDTVWKKIKYAFHCCTEAKISFSSSCRCRKWAYLMRSGGRKWHHCAIALAGSCTRAQTAATCVCGTVTHSAALWPGKQMEER